MASEIVWSIIPRNIAICPQCGHSLRMCIIEGHDDVDPANYAAVFSGKIAVTCEYDDEVPHAYNGSAWEQTIGKLRDWAFAD